MLHSLKLIFIVFQEEWKSSILYVKVVHDERQLEYVLHDDRVVHDERKMDDVLHDERNQDDKFVYDKKKWDDRVLHDERQDKYGE